MPIQIQCGSCGRRGKVKDEYAGRRIRCPDCQEPISVPAVEDDFDGDYADYEVDYEDEEFDERPSPARTRRRQGRRGRARSRQKPRAERGWLRRHWHWMAALVMMLFALWPKQGLVIIALFGAVGVLMVFIGGLFPFVRIIYGAPGTVLLLLLSRSARFDMLYQPDDHPYKVLCRKAFDPTRGLFWKGVLLVVTCIAAGIINKAIPAGSRAGAPDPVHSTAGGGNEPRFGFPPREPAGSQSPRLGPRVFFYTVTYGSYTGAKPVDEAALSALRINPGSREETLEVDEETRTIKFQYWVRVAPHPLTWSFESRGFRDLTVQLYGD